jgi:PAS domain S-box-containing protein
MEALIQAQSILISASDDADAVESALSLTGQAGGVSSAHIYQNHLDYVENRRLAAERFFWDRDVRLGSFMYSESEWLDYDQFMPDCFERLEQMEILHVDINRDLPAENRGFFREQKVSTILMIPIEVDRKFWGFLGMVDRGVHPRQWTARELNVLMVTARSLGECLSRIITEQNLKLYREIIFTMQDGLAILDKSGCYEEQNVAREKLLGYRLDEIKGDTPAIHFGEDVISDVFSELLEKGLYRGEKETISKSGHRLVIDLTITAVNDEFGDPICYLEVTRNITQQKLQENAILEAKKVAEEANRAKSEFLANMSHEIRTPMNGVIGMTRLLQETELDEDQEDYILTLRSSGEHLMKIINDILDFSKIEAGKMTLDLAEMDTHRVIEEAVELFAGKARENDITLSYYIDLDIPETVEADSVRIGQVLNNLINNSIKFTKSGYVHVEMGPAPDDLVNPFAVDEKDQNAPRIQAGEEQVRLLFQVRDSGIGISPEKLREMFDPFTQADTSTTRRYGGTGLGLSISKLICEMMNGSIWAESEEGCGSTFYFLIPLKVLDHEPCEYAKAFQPDLKEKNLLVVEDSPQNIYILQNYAEFWNMEFRDPLEDVKDVPRLLSMDACPYDVVLANVRMLEQAGVDPREFQKALVEMGGAVIFSVPTEKKFETEDHPELDKPIILHDPLSPDGLHKCLIDAVGAVLPRQPRLEPRVTHSFDLNPNEQDTRKDLKILIVEDNLINQKVILEYLSKLGLSAEAVDNGYDSIKKVEQTDYDLILMDVQMPQIDGLKATRLIREVTGNRPRPTIIAITARALKGDREACLRAGMDDYLTKPVEISKLRELLFKQKYG